MPEDKKHEEHNKITLTVIVSGAPTQVEANIHEPLRVVVEAALDQTGNDTGRALDEWEIKDSSGNQLDVSQKIQDFNFPPGTKLFLSPRIGAGG